METEFRGVLKVFLASPGDLGEERQIAREIVDRLGPILGRELGLHVDLLGWEDTVPGSGRPQEIINRDVDVCDIFVGLLWGRWGEPTGEFSSGFEEEFTRAADRQRTSGKPEIWLFFKQVDSARLADPGQQLQRVLAFRARRAEARDLLYKEFEDARAWERLFQNCLLEHMLRIGKGRLLAAVGSEARAHESEFRALDKPMMQLGGGARYPDEVVQIADFVRSRVLSEGFGVMDPNQAARLYLLAKSWFARLRLGEVLGVHECNVFYAMRDELVLAGEELELLIRSLVSDEYGTKPGHYWMRDWSNEEVVGYFSFLATNDSEAEVRAGAVRLLAFTEHSPTEGWIVGVLADKDARVRSAFLRYLESRGQPESVALTEQLLTDADYSVRNEAVRVRLRLIAREDPAKAFEELLALGVTGPDEVVSDLRPVRARAKPETLRRMIATQWAELRRLAAEGLAESPNLDTSELRQLGSDPDGGVAAPALLALIAKGEDVEAEFKRFAERWQTSPTRFAFLRARESPDESVRFARVRALNREQLLDRLEFYDVEGPDAYRALA